MEKDQEKISSLESNIRMIMQQIGTFEFLLINLEFFKYECDRALDNIKEAYRKLGEENISELSRIKNPPA